MLFKKGNHRLGNDQKKENNTERFFDYTLLFVVIFLVCFGLVMIYSSSAYSAQMSTGNSFSDLKRQLISVALGFVVMMIVSRFDYHFWSKFIVLAYIGMIVLQAAVFFIGVEVNGQKRWIGPEGMRFQPSELAKLVLILCIAYIASRSVKNLQKLSGIIKVFLLAMPLVILVTIANLSTGIILLGITFIVIFIASNRYAPFAAVIVGGIAVMVVFLQTQAYRLVRIVAWLNVETHPKAYQTRQSLYAIGSGGLFGKGLGQSIQKLNYLPEAHNDMIFAVVCEELGLFGAIAVILLFVLLLWRCMIIANNAPDLFGALLVIGVMAQIGLQVIINIAVATNTIPNTGIPLPFISYGGTSVIFLLSEIGLVLGVSRQIKFTR